ncbi:integral membrane protein [Actinidia rufa]|uniref:Integral membrane protein n=1 Tax=Actinidia rufa TaxID=165716 RepID=A0A7J0DRC7_9ERIC|nr:integral membrane protein [Actinidia rufa]
MWRAFGPSDFLLVVAYGVVVTQKKEKKSSVDTCGGFVAAWVALTSQATDLRCLACEHNNTYHQLSASPSRHGGCQKTLYHVSHLMSPVIPWDYYRSLPLTQAFSAVIILSLLRSSASGLIGTSALARPMSNGVHTELWRRGPRSLLCSDSSSGVPTLARSGDVIGTAATKLKMGQKEAQGVAEKRKGRRGPGSVVGSSAAGCVCAFLSIVGVGGILTFGNFGNGYAF